jgi:hypothetical protein
MEECWLNKEHVEIETSFDRAEVASTFTGWSLGYSEFVETLFDDNPLLARDVEALSDMACRIRTRRTQLPSNVASSPPEAGIRDQLK